jgi:hypothetical protein
MTILPKHVSRRNKITRKKHYWKNCQVSENSKHDIRTTPNKPYRTKRELSTPKSRSTQVEHTKAIVCENVNTLYTTIFFYVGLRFFGFHLLVILAIFCSYFWLIIWVYKLLAFSSADEELFSEMATQDIKFGIDCFFLHAKVIVV